MERLRPGDREEGWLLGRLLARDRVFWSFYALLAVVVAVAGFLGGLIFGYAVDLPEVSELEKIRPNVVSYVYSEDGRVLGQFAVERRILVSYEEIPEILKQAILAVEDATFFQHGGIDFRRVLATAFFDLVRWERKGASTLTMQLSKVRFTSPEKTFERKIKDALYAIEIEKNYSKEQIFTFYANQIYLGHGNYGLAAAADFYFDKTLDQLTLSECALLAGLLKGPENFTPIRYPERALQRRNIALRRMFEEGYIDEETYRETSRQPLEVRGKNQGRSPAPYFVEWVRQYLEKNYSTEQIWKGGLKIYTTLNYDLQLAAQRALRNGLRRFDHEKRSWEGAEENILDRGEDLESYTHPDWRQIFYEGQMLHGLVTAVEAEKALVKMGSYTAELNREGIAWTGRKRVDQALRVGDVALFTIQKLDRSTRKMEVHLDRIPEVQGALLVLDNKSGAVRAMVGGFDFQYSQFNRATQALRQPGSIFKPFTYIAALEEGYDPNDLVLDAPVNYLDELGRPYAPTNSDEEFKGLIPLWQALAESRNVPTIRLANALGIRKVIEVARRFGIDRNYPPFLPIALGAGELTLQEITSAFSALPNRGVRTEPYFIQRIEDYHGVVLEEHRPSFRQAVSPEIASRMIHLLRNVVERGTGRRALALNRPVAGKTGTTNDSTDTWFVGFTPSITAGVWVGYDEKKPLGEKIYGNNLALPIWVEFMEEALKDTPVEDFDTLYAPPPLDLARTAGEDAQQPAGKPPMQRAIAVEDIPPPPLP